MRLFCISGNKADGSIKRHSKCSQCRNITNLKRKHLLGIHAPRCTKPSQPISKAVINERNKQWREDNPQKWQAANRLNRHRRRALGKINSSEWIAKVMMLGNRCQFCAKTEPEVKITIDHIIPVSKGGTNHIDNLQPLCMHCNQTKHAKYPTSQYASELITI